MIFSIKNKVYYSISLSLLLVFMVISPMWGQQIVHPQATNSDFEGAVLLMQNQVKCTASPSGYGEKMEIQSTRSNKQSLEKEHHTIWYRFVADKECVLSFELQPFNSKDDYDFMLFSLTPNSKDSLELLRCNKARRDLNIAGKTGLKSHTQLKFVGEGPGESFSEAVQSEAGQVFYLLVDNVYKNGQGHSLHIEYSDCTEIKPIVKTPSYHLSLTILDKEEKKAIEAGVQVIAVQYPKPPDTIINERSLHLFAPVKLGKKYKIRVMEKGYLTHEELINLYPTDTLKEIVVALQAVRPGKKIVLENIYFPGGSSNFLRKSMPALKELASIMKNNPDLHIEIQGHVNLPHPRPRKYKDSYYMDLSEARAKAVYNYLIKRRIDKSRISYKGMSYSQMKYPKAKTSYEQQQNRRVEILIIKV